MQPPYTYDILNNPEMSEKLQFTTIMDRSTKAEDALNDMIIKTLYTGFYLTRKGAIQFDQGDQTEYFRAVQRHKVEERKKRQEEQAKKLVMGDMAQAAGFANII